MGAVSCCSVRKDISTLLVEGTLQIGSDALLMEKGCNTALEKSEDMKEQTDSMDNNSCDCSPHSTSTRIKSLSESSVTIVKSDEEQVIENSHGTMQVLQQQLGKKDASTQTDIVEPKIPPNENVEDKKMIIASKSASKSTSKSASLAKFKSGVRATMALSRISKARKKSSRFTIFGVADRSKPFYSSSLKKRDSSSLDISRPSTPQSRAGTPIQGRSSSPVGLPIRRGSIASSGSNGSNDSQSSARTSPTSPKIPRRSFNKGTSPINVHRSPGISKRASLANIAAIAERGVRHSRTLSGGASENFRRMESNLRRKSRVSTPTDLHRSSYRASLARNRAARHSRTHSAHNMGVKFLRETSKSSNSLRRET